MISVFLFQSTLVQTGFILAASLIIWRLVRFTIIPCFRPHEPREYPYWIPGLGHVISYLRDSFSTLNNARNHFNDDRKPFTINLAGEMMYIITAPADVTAAYRNTANLTMDVFLKDMFRCFDISEPTLDLLYEKPGQGGHDDRKLLSDNPHNKPLAHLTVDFYRVQLYPGDELTKLGEVTLEYIEWAMRWENFNDPAYVIAESAAGSSRDISLLHWCEDILLRAAVRSFFGDVLTDQTPDLLKDFLAFDNVSWKLMYRVPKPFAKDMHAAKDKLVDALEKYFRLPKEQRPNSNWFIKMQEAEMDALGISKREFSKVIALIYWVINTNAYKLLFWMTAFLMLDPSLIAQVREELQSSFREDGTLDIPSLQSQTTYLTALFHESMRVSNSSSSARFVTTDTQIGPYTLKAGRRLLIPYRQLHLNRSVFGDNAAEFDINRFLDNKKLSSHPSYRPFGGGVTYCPGRFLAKQEIFMALAYLLCRYDVQLLPGKEQKFPKMDELKPGIGIIGPIEGDDLIVRVTRKK